MNGQTFSAEEPFRYSFCGPDGERCRQQASVPWALTQAAAEEAYDRSAECSFTSFVGSEWTGMPGGDNTHRNLVYRNANVPDAPPNYIDHPTPEALWERLEEDCIEAGIGCDVLAIPHNSNVSNGKMWPSALPGAPALDAEAARRQATHERLVEVTQHKGDSECRAGTAGDELCAFETLPYAQMTQMAGGLPATEPPRGAYVREALAAGLVQQTESGVNPFAFGLIGATDNHMATPGLVEEDLFVGHAAGTVTSRLEAPPIPDRLDFNPGGLAVLWAEENSRDSLFEAMRRREAYGTSGPRMVVRFFGGWDFDAALCGAEDFVETGYAQGVPMGADLPAAASSAPVFAAWALQDVGTPGHPGTPLQRIQVVKAWVEGGEARERVVDVAGDPANGASVDLDTCTPRGPGAGDLCAIWRDPDFDPASPAMYYARVVENPSCRWNQYVCNANSIDCSVPDRVPEEFASCCDPDVPKTIQERAWTSPVWYTPAAD